MFVEECYDASPFRPLLYVWGPCFLWLGKRAAVDQSIPDCVASPDLCV